MAMEPDREAVLRAIREFDSIDATEFFARYSGGKRPRAHYLRHEGGLYPLKAIWAAAHAPPVQTATFNTKDARSGLRMLGFETFVEDEELIGQYLEGRMIVREVAVFTHNAQLADLAKRHYAFTCQVCGLTPAAYGDLGARFIECHHIEPLSGRGGEGVPTSLDDVTVVCANCHRMIHQQTPCLTVEELKSAFQPARRSK